MKRFLILCLLLSVIILVPCLASAIPTENTWVSKAEIPQAELGSRAAVVNGKIYYIGGKVNYEYDPINDSWTPKTAMPIPRTWFSIAVYQNKIYTFAGQIAQYQCNLAEVYDPATDTWAPLSQLPVNASSIDANEVNGIIYLAGLPNSGSSVSVNLAYNVAANTWTERTPMPYPSNSYSSTVFDGKIYFFGGYDFTLRTTHFNNQTRIYDPYTDRWTLGSPVPGLILSSTAACATTGIMAPKRIYIFGGQTQSAEGTKTTWIYNPENKSWAFGSTMPTARLGPTVAKVNDQFYIFGGSAYAVFTGPLTVNEQYTPYGYGFLETVFPSETSLTVGSSSQADLILQLIAILIVLAVIGIALRLLLNRKKDKI